MTELLYHKVDVRLKRLRLLKNNFLKEIKADIWRTAEISVISGALIVIKKNCRYAECARTKS